MQAKSIIWALLPDGSRNAAIHQHRLQLNRTAEPLQTAGKLEAVLPPWLLLGHVPPLLLPPGYGILAGPGPEVRAAGLPRLQPTQLRITDTGAAVAVEPAVAVDELRRLLQDHVPGFQPQLPAAVPAAAVGAVGLEDQHGSPLDPAPDSLLQLGRWVSAPDARTRKMWNQAWPDLKTALQNLAGLQIVCAAVSITGAGAVVWEPLYQAPLRKR
ncbi:MAG: hypothetical protein ACOC0D_01095 [Spirochaeta sp.]